MDPAASASMQLTVSTIPVVISVEVEVEVGENKNRHVWNEAARIKGTMYMCKGIVLAFIGT